MSKHYQSILQKIKAGSHSERVTLHSDSYSGSSHKSYHVKTADSRNIAKDWAILNKDISSQDLIETLTSLAKGESSDEKMMVGKILEYLPKRRNDISPELIDKWLEDFVGWAEIDSLCQSSITYKELLSNWDEWREVLKKLNYDENLSKRRASLVLLTGCVSHSADERLADLAFENIDNLKQEKDILITKAISWLLRDLVKQHRKSVEEYIETNAKLLPAIAIRETKNKLATGKK